MSEAEQPMVQLTWDLWCNRHLEPYRAQWPKGAGLAMLRLFDTAAKMPAVADVAKGDAANLTEALRRFRPLCCFVGQQAMNRIYAETYPRVGGEQPVRASSDESQQPRDDPATPPPGLSRS